MDNSSSHCTNAWISNARDGFCTVADFGGGDCLNGDKGSWSLPPATDSWRTAAATCTARCHACARCRFLSISLRWKDCTWSHEDCELQHHVPGFRTAPRCTWKDGGGRVPRFLGDIHERQTGSSFDRSSPLEAPSGKQLWLAVGVILAPGVNIASSQDPSPLHVGSRFLHQGFASLLNGTVAWQYVTTDTSRHDDPRFVVVRCRDGPFSFDMSNVDRPASLASACACKTILWFRRALELFPRARFYAKLEDDAALHDARVLTELRHAYGRYGPEELMWYGYFQWAGLHPESRRNGWFCGEGDNLLRVFAPRCPQPRNRHQPRAALKIVSATGASNASHANDKGRALVGPFASGGLDVRSHRLTQALSRCGIAHQYAHEWTSAHAHAGCEDHRVGECGPNDYCAACDAIQGDIIMRCMGEGWWSTAGLPDEVTLLHLTWSKFHAPVPMASTSVVHAGELKDGDAAAPRREAYRWHIGHAMLPLEFRFSLSSSGAQWRAMNASAVAAYEAVSRSASKLCAERTGPCEPVPDDAALRLDRQ